MSKESDAKDKEFRRDSYWNKERLEEHAQKCLVKGCTNHRRDVKFVGELCWPCYSMLLEGTKRTSHAWFAKPWVGLTGVEINHIFAANVGYPERMMKEVENLLKEKNGG